MAMLAIASMSEAQQESKMPHPFFMKRSKSREDVIKPLHESVLVTASTTADASILSTDTVAQAAEAEEARRGRPRKNSSEKEERQAGAELLEVDPNHERRKRRKSTSEENSPIGSGSETIYERKTAVKCKNIKKKLDLRAGCVDAGAVLSSKGIATAKAKEQAPKTGTGFQIGETDLDDHPPISSEPSLHSQAAANVQFIGVYLPETMASESTAPDPTLPPARKLLHLNSRTGTIGSPPKSNTKPVREPKSKNRKTKGSDVPRSRIVNLKYGHDRESQTRIGQRIESLMNSSKEDLIVPDKQLTKEAPTSKPVSVCEPPKPTHPFFLGKTVPNSDVAPIPVDTSLDMPIDSDKASSNKARKTFTTARSSFPLKQNNTSSGGYGHTFGNSGKISKFPGAIEPCWPPIHMMHVRGFDGEDDRPVTTLPFLDPVKVERKSKRAIIHIPATEEIIGTIAAGFHITEVAAKLSQISSDEFAKPDQCLRVPKRHFESGVELQKQVGRQLISPLPVNTESQSSEDEIQSSAKREAKLHPALEKIYLALPTSLSAFDRSTYETQSWISKYAPASAAEVLQTGKEAFIVRDWLLALTVVAVDTGIIDDRSRSGSVASKHSVGKRKRRSNRLEGFVISSDEEDGDMDEVSEPEGNDSPRGSQGLLKRTVIRASDASRREVKKLANAVVISGPNGCGKTATVYAVAKELGFEVFEINSSSRRSGKDVLEKVGDMTRNHQVQRSKHGAADLLNDDIARLSDALAEDLRSGRQGTMNSFLKPKDPKPLKAPLNEKEKAAKPSNKRQQQSLILLEEVDVLFEEDKQFWTTVMTLIAQSKRPVIMTCNDETLVPLQALTLHAIIRLTPAPIDIAIDYMLLMAAAEGHIIKRHAVESLYEARGLDLRASITDLDYWCQLGVGDCKGGMDWFYPRWPPGSDVDAKGNTIRVVSEGTYDIGIGWLGRDSLFDPEHEKNVEQEFLREVWDGWQIDIPLLHQNNSLLSTLNSHEDMIDFMSAADMIASGTLATGNQALLDTTLPQLTNKSRDDFILGRELLEADLVNDFDTTAKSFAFCLQALAGNNLKNAVPNFKSHSPNAIMSQLVDAIVEDGVRVDGSISRQDFSVAFDPIAEAERKYSWSAPSLEPSVFDRTTTMIAQDVAPYVRSIVAYDARLQQERVRLSNLLSEGGRKGKRMRTTRAALSALEGGARNTTRPERYFGPNLNPMLVLRTGHQSWQDAADCELADGKRTEEAGMDHVDDDDAAKSIGTASPRTIEHI